MPLLLKLRLKLLLSCFKYVQLRAYSAYQSKRAINPTLLLVRSKEIERCDVGKVEVSSPSSLKVMRFCLDDDEDWKKRDRRRETTLTRKKRRESHSPRDEGSEEEERRTNAFFLSKSRSITTGGALVRVRFLRAKVYVNCEDKVWVATLVLLVVQTRRRLRICNLLSFYIFRGRRKRR